MGADQLGIAFPLVQGRDTGPDVVPGRSCGSCSLCCKLFAVIQLSKPAGQWCQHARPGSGCTIHDGRPDGCRQFFCAWLLDPALGPEWKPDVARFALTATSVYQGLLVMVDPGMPLAWKRAPYYQQLKSFSERLFAENKRVVVSLRGAITVVLPDRDVALGMPPPGAEIAVWREGSSYGAKLQPPRDDSGLVRQTFIEAFAQSSRLLDDPSKDELTALAAIARAGKENLDHASAAYAKAAGAECAAGCASCCYLMAMATPFEVLAIAGHLLETRGAAEIESIKQRLRRLSQVPLDWTERASARLPCALLDESNRCSIYDQRPSMCRATLSQSRAACETCLKDGRGDIPCVEQPRKIAAASQMGADYALISRRHRSIELVELSRALLIALDDFQGAMTAWFAGADPFADAHVRGAVSTLEKTLAAARRFGLARVPPGA